MRPKVDYRTTSKDNYEKFCLENSNIEISFKQWKDILEKFSENIIDYILETGEKIKLPYGLGDLSINKKKPKRTKYFQGKEYINFAIDWKKTRELGKYVYHMNYHSDGFTYSWIWFKANCRFYQSELWWFRACRKASRSIKPQVTNNSYYAQLYNQWK